MPRSRPWMLAVAVIGLLLPVSVFAQIQPPTPEELAMKADPKAPGAAAVFLNYEESTDDNINFERISVRIKVLTEKGKELATVNAGYLKKVFTISDIKGRTIHSDGSIYPLEVKPETLLVNKSEEFEVNQKVFTLPNVEVGSILEYTMEVHWGEEWAFPPTWEVQQDYFVHKAHFTFVKTKYIGGYTMFLPVLPEGAKVKEDLAGRFTLDVTDIPAGPKEEYGPPENAVRYRVIFYYSGYSNKEDFWKYAGERWAKNVNRFAGEDKKLAEDAQGLVAGAATDEAKARKLYDAVMALDNTDFSRRKTKTELKDLHLKEARKATDIWNQKSGESDDLALLYLALLRSVGIKAYAMAVTDRGQGIFNPNIFSFYQFQDHRRDVEEIVVVAELGGKDVFLDPGQRYCTFGQLSWRHAFAGGIRQTEKGTELANTPGVTYKDAVMTRTAGLTVAADGSVSGTARITLSGPEALRWREMALTDGEDETKTQFNHWLEGILPEGVHGELGHFLGLAETNSVLMAVVPLSGQLGTLTGQRMFLPYTVFTSRKNHPFVEDATRMTAVDMHFAETVKDEVDYTLPEGYAVETLPADATESLPQHAIYKTAAVAAKNVVTVNRNMARNFVIIEPGSYGQLREFYQKLAAADQQQIVLTHTEK